MFGTSAPHLSRAYLAPVFRIYVSYLCLTSVLRAYVLHLSYPPIGRVLSQVSIRFSCCHHIDCSPALWPSRMLRCTWISPRRSDDTMRLDTATASDRHLAKQPLWWLRSPTLHAFWKLGALSNTGWRVSAASATPVMRPDCLAWLGLVESGEWRVESSADSHAVAAPMPSTRARLQRHDVAVCHLMRVRRVIAVPKRGILYAGEWVGSSRITGDYVSDGLRKVRTPQGEALGNSQEGRPYGKWHRNYTAARIVKVRLQPAGPAIGQAVAAVVRQG